MKKLLQIVAFPFFLALCLSMQAQTRYLDETFSTVKVDTSVIYSWNYGYGTGFTRLDSLVMDVYRPEGDLATNRPLILLGHNGSFLPEIYSHFLAGLCFNGRKDSSMVELCKRFARRGYVAVSFDYRLGWNATANDQVTKSKTIIQAVYRAMQDSKSLVRYFKNDFANGNQWGIDTSKITIGGTNSGAYVALAAGSLNDPAELNNIKFMDIHGSYVKQDTTGDFDGFGGVQNHDNYPGISSKFQCVLALGGAVGDTSWIQVGEPPVIAFQGVSEEGTPYNTAVVTTTTNDPIIEVSGSGDFMPVVIARGNNNVFLTNNFLQGPPNRNGFGVQTVSLEGLYPFYGQYFEPWNWYDPTCYTNSQQMQNLSDPSNSANWATPQKGNRYIDTIMGYALPRLYKLFIDHNLTTWNGINEVKEEARVAVYPNPASSEIYLSVGDGQKPISEVHLLDITGRLVSAASTGSAFNKTMDVSTLNNGIYVVLVKLTDGTSATHKVVIER